MNQIENQIDQIILGLKSMESLGEVRFVREYGVNKTELPISGLLAVVSVTDMAQSKEYIGGYVASGLKGEQYSAKAEIRVYAPATENGNGLSEVVSEMLVGLKNADSQGIIQNLNAYSIQFDADMNAIYRTICFDVEFCLCEEA